METAPRGRSLALSKLLHHDKDEKNLSTNSRANSPDSGIHAHEQPQQERPGLRASMESAIDKVKDRTLRRGSVGGIERRDSDDSRVESRRLSTLVSKTKRKVKKGWKVGDDDSQRRPSMDSRLGIDELGGNHSDSSLLLDGSGQSSLLTDDDRSEPDG